MLAERTCLGIRRMKTSEKRQIQMQLSFSLKDMRWNRVAIGMHLQVTQMILCAERLKADL